MPGTAARPYVTENLCLRFGVGTICVGTILPARERKLAMAGVTMRQVLEGGAHSGHQPRRWNPKMKRFILTERNGIYIIDLQQSLEDIDRAFDFVKSTVS